MTQMSDDHGHEVEYKPGGCRILIGTMSIGIGIVVLVVGFPFTVIPAAVLIGGGARLIWNVGSI